MGVRLPLSQPAKTRRSEAVMLPTCFGFGRHACSAMCNAARIGACFSAALPRNFRPGCLECSEMLGMLGPQNAWPPDCPAPGVSEKLPRKNDAAISACDSGTEKRNLILRIGKLILICGHATVFACEKIVRKARFFRQPALWSAQPRVRHLRNRASGTRAPRVWRPRAVPRARPMRARRTRRRAARWPWSAPRAPSPTRRSG